jgi:hypothetical protein
VSGTGKPNESDCIEIIDCGPDGICGNADDVVLATGGTDGAGNFLITVSPPLVGGHKIFPKDTCNNGLTGPPVIVSLPVAAPALSPVMILLLAAALAITGLARARSTRRRGTHSL